MRHVTIRTVSLEPVPLAVIGKCFGEDVPRILCRGQETAELIFFLLRKTNMHAGENSEGGPILRVFSEVRDPRRGRLGRERIPSD